jgi:hypothetical protein
MVSGSYLPFRSGFDALVVVISVFVLPWVVAHLDPRDAHVIDFRLSRTRETRLAGMSGSRSEYTGWELNGRIHARGFRTLRRCPKVCRGSNGNGSQEIEIIVICPSAFLCGSRAE